MVNFKNLLGLLVVLLLSAPLGLFAQTRTVTGVVRTATETLIGATVTADGKSNVGVITDIDGRFSMKVPSGTKKLRVSYQGYKTVDVPRTSQSNYEVTLVEDAKMLDEVVAIGYAKVRRRDLTGSTVSVGSEDLQLAPVTTAAQALAGKAAGVNVIQQSGAPGADIQITVRGGTSITQSTSPLYIVDGFQMENGLQNVDINDIETIDVMKDASATAIYGARGSNGVILITTKSGKTGKTEINYNGFVSFNTLGKHLDLLNTEQYVKYQYEFQALRGNTAQWANMFYNGDFNDPSFGATVADYIHNNYANRSTIDWQDQVFGKTGITQNHNVTLSGGNEKTRYMLSYNFVGENGIMDKHGYKKNSIRAKINHELMKGVRFDFASSMQVTAIDGGGSLGGKLKQTILMPATGGILWTDQQMIGSDTGREIGNMMGEANYDSRNPIIDNLSITNTRFTRFITVNAGLEVDIIKNLTFRTAGSYMWQQTRNDYWDNGNTKQAEANASQYGYGYRNNAERSSYQWTNTLNYNFSIVDEHNFGILLGHELYYQDNMKLDNEYRGFSDGNFGLNDVSMGKAFDWNSGNDRNGLVSFFGRLNYNYAEKYMVEAAFRADASSRFAKGHRWGVFPSVSLGWVISNEKWMENVKPISYLKIRGSAGSLGNERIGYYPAQASINLTNAIMFDSKGTAVTSQLAAAQTAIAIPDITWETTDTYDVGLDMSFLNNRLSLSGDYYYKKTRNMLLALAIPAFTGYGSPDQNAGTMFTRGWEAKISWNDRVGDFSYGISFNVSDYTSIMGNLNGKVVIGTNTITREGDEYQAWYGYKNTGIFQNEDQIAQAPAQIIATISPGDIGYADLSGIDGTPDGKISADYDRTVLGSSMPHFIFGGSLNFGWKGIGLSILFNGVGKQLAKVSEMMVSPFYSQWLAAPACFLNADGTRNYFSLYNTDEQNAKAQYPRLSYTSGDKNNYLMSDYWLMNGAYFRIKNINLSYTFPQNIIGRAKMKGLKVYFNADDPFCFDNYLKGWDPEQGTNTYIARNFTFGLEIKL